MMVLLAGGGTGGHVYPALAIANELRHRHPDWDIQFAGRHDSIEGKAVPKEGYTLNELYVSGFERYYSALKKAKVALRAVKSMFDANRIISRLKPNIVIGTGGYISGPMVLAAHLRRLPTLICEQNVIPGFTIKTLSRYADTVCLPFADAKAYMAKPERCVLTGNPVRREFGLFDRSIARKSLKVEDNEKLIVSFGGSLGAASINGAVIGSLDYFADKPVKLIHITGNSSYEEAIASLPAELPGNVQITAYSDEMPMLLNAADLVISRAGAMSVSEINYVGVAAIYIPYPIAVNDHQTKNAQYCEASNAALIIKDSELTPESLQDAIGGFIQSPGALMAMAQNSRRIGITDSAERISIEAEKLIDSKWAKPVN
ncbi:MAG: undecaprenyldiphospho-muramoylpentapeptide beta-N-acetylglucosaminyltransferase [Eubacteriaceae bacterium]|nr:undecaprenyldiphospho-muramoylpentapeptide beta-N-acetylglucosaminyltransferase [Eubacteriaceae bacterium]